MLTLIRDMRDSANMHLLLCSHLLRDVEETCDEVLILKGGRIAHHANLEEERRANTRFVDIDTPGAGRGACRRDPGVGLRVLACGGRPLPDSPAAALEVRDIYRVAAERDLPLRRLNYRRDTLEEIFLKAMDA